MTDPVSYSAGALLCEQAPLEEVAAQTGTPCYVYSSNAILDRFRAYDCAFGAAPHKVCYAVKANGNLSILRLLAGAGAGFDIVSGGELFRVLKAGGDPATVVFSGAGKTAEEIGYALDRRIHSFNAESLPELRLVSEIAVGRGVQARVALRVNPDVNAETHPYISTGLREHKFGIDIAEVEAVYAEASHLPNLLVEGASCHIGSQLLDASPVLEAVERMLALIDRLRAAGIPVQTLDLGGGLGISYRPGQFPPSPSAFIEQVCRLAAGRDLTLMIEPGRSIVGDAGVLLTRVLYRKRNGSKEFVIVDAAMNDLLRPSLYQAHHEILPVREAARNTITADVVGPICETGDFLARNREIADVQAGDLLAVRTAGAYGFVLSSNYNGRPRAAEVLVEGGAWRVVRQRETRADLIRGEA